MLQSLHVLQGVFVSLFVLIYPVLHVQCRQRKTDNLSVSHQTYGLHLEQLWRIAHYRDLVAELYETQGLITGRWGGDDRCIQ